MKFNSDIDIDFGNRDAALGLLKHTPASIVRNGELVRHNTGVYVTDVPVDPATGQCALDYRVTERRSYIKLDFLNVSVYAQVKNEEHLTHLMQEPLWELLQEEQFVAQLIHIGNHYNTMTKMPEPVDSIPRLAMLLAVIRPAKRHLIGLPWREVAKTVWDKGTDGYIFKRSHSCAYAQLVVVHMNLLCEQERNGV